MRELFFTPIYCVVDNPMQSGTGAKCNDTVRVFPRDLNIAQYRARVVGVSLNGISQFFDGIFILVMT